MWLSQKLQVSPNVNGGPQTEQMQTCLRKSWRVWEAVWGWAAAERRYLLCRGRAEGWQQLGSGRDGFQSSAPSPSRPGCCNNGDVTPAVKEEASKVTCLNILRLCQNLNQASHLPGAWLRSDLFFGSAHYKNFSESKVRLRTHWWHINIRREDMGIPAGDRRGIHWQFVALVRRGDESGVMCILQKSLWVVFSNKLWSNYDFESF